jgi:hypothetical protein
MNPRISSQITQEESSKDVENPERLFQAAEIIIRGDVKRVPVLGCESVRPEEEIAAVVGNEVGAVELVIGEVEVVVLGKDGSGLVGDAWGPCSWVAIDVLVPLQQASVVFSITMVAEFVTTGALAIRRQLEPVIGLESFSHQLRALPIKTLTR